MNSVPAQQARPRIEAMVTTGARASRPRTSVHAGRPVGPAGNASVRRRSSSPSYWGG